MKEPFAVDRELLERARKLSSDLKHDLGIDIHETDPFFAIYGLMARVIAEAEAVQEVAIARLGSRLEESRQRWDAEARASASRALEACFEVARVEMVRGMEAAVVKTATSLSVELERVRPALLAIEGARLEIAAGRGQVARLAWTLLLASAVVLAVNLGIVAVTVFR